LKYFASDLEGEGSPQLKVTNRSGKKVAVHAHPSQGPGLKRSIGFFATLRSAGTSSGHGRKADESHADAARDEEAQRSPARTTPVVRLTGDPERRPRRGARGSPGRDLLINDRHTFEDIARAIDRAFARWDLSHLHEFGLLDGRRIAMEDANESAEMSGEQPLDERLQTLTTVGLGVGETFQYLFDFGDGWEHGCTLLREDVDPVAEWGSVPKEIVPIFGWGTIPDQYGRSSAEQGETG
jgi:hypothetical protein